MLRPKTLLTACLWIALPVSLFAAEGRKLPFDIFNRLRVEWDDNARLERTNEDSSFKLIEEVEFIVNLDLENTFLGFRYSPSFVWWDDRPEDDTDVHHHFDASINHDFSPRLSINLKDVFRIAQLPQLADADGIDRSRDNDYLYNSINGGARAILTETLRMSVDGRYITLQYDEASIARESDYDKFIVGADLGQRIAPETHLSGQVRWSATSYDRNERDSDSIQVGLALESMLNPKVQTSIRVGYEQKNYDNTTLNSTDSPYANATTVFKPSADTTFNLGASFSQTESPITDFANQERFTVFAGTSLDLTARVAAHVNGSISNGSYDRDESLDTSRQAGDEKFSRLSARLTYQVNHANWLEAGWQYVTLDSDVRRESEYDRNRFHVGWKTAL